MKAEYVKPYVTIEDFDPNVAIAACDQGTYIFDCLYGTQADPANVLSKALNIECTNNCGFADYTGSTSGAEDQEYATAANGYTTTDSLHAWAYRYENGGEDGSPSFGEIVDGSHSRHNENINWVGETQNTGEWFNPETHQKEEYTYYTGWTGQVTANAKSADGGTDFLGWLYIGKGSYNDPWLTEFSGTGASGFLKIATSAMHLLLAPLYGKKASDVAMS